MNAPSDELRRIARERIESRRGFIPHLIVFVLVNAGLVAIWATTSQGFFWPGFVIGFWAIGLVMHAWAAFISRPVTDADVQREMERLQRRSA
jgi:hypothetical protein